jgi:hypothetical protein
MAVKDWTSLEHFIQVNEELLQLERADEAKEQANIFSKLSLESLEKRGVCLRRLDVLASSTGLYGRTMVTFKLTNGLPLPATRIGPGDTVSVSNADAAGLISLGQGVCQFCCFTLTTQVVTSVNTLRVCVAFEDPVDGLESTRLVLLKLCDDVTFRRYQQ